MSGVDIDLSLEDVWKQYRLSARRDASTFWALRGITLQVARGESVGVIGRNGAGKSTLLKLLAGITAPTRGRIVLHGRVAALIEVGSGFHPELTGRENVFLSGSILGMRRREIAAKFDRIVEFAGVEPFIDTPVKWYSSGMYVRLGFAVAAHMEPDILLIDEVLAVGDAEFQMKCLARIQQLTREGTTSLFISHDLTAVERLCERAVLLENGGIAAAGAPAQVVADYHRRLTSAAPEAGLGADASRQRDVALTNVTVKDPQQPAAVAFRTGAPLQISVRYAAASPVRNVEVELRYYSADGKTLIAAPRTGAEPFDLRPPGGCAEFTCDALPLRPGAYYLGAVIRNLASGEVLAWWDGETRLYVQSGPAAAGQIYVPHTWRIIHAEDLPTTTPASTSLIPRS